MRHMENSRPARATWKDPVVGGREGQGGCKEGTTVEVLRAGAGEVTLVCAGSKPSGVFLGCSAPGSL